MAATPQISIRLPPALRVELERLAALDRRRSLSEYVVMVLEDHAAAKGRPRVNAKAEP